MQEGRGWTIHGVGFKNSFAKRGSKIISAIEEKDSVIALMNDDLQVIKYENVALQAQREVYQTQL